MAVQPYATLTGAGTTVLVPPLAGRSGGLTAIWIAGDPSSANNIQFEDTNGGNLTGNMPIPAGSQGGIGFRIFAPPGLGIQAVTSGGTLNLSFVPTYL